MEKAIDLNLDIHLIRSLVLSTANGLNEKEINNGYKNFTGNDIDYQKHGFSSLWDYLRTSMGLETIERINGDGNGQQVFIVRKQLQDQSTTKRLPVKQRLSYGPSSSSSACNPLPVYPANREDISKVKLPSASSLRQDQREESTAIDNQRYCNPSPPNDYFYQGYSHRQRSRERKQSSWSSDDDWEDNRDDNQVYENDYPKQDRYYKYRSNESRHHKGRYDDYSRSKVKKAYHHHRRDEINNGESSRIDRDWRRSDRLTESIRSDDLFKSIAVQADEEMIKASLEPPTKSVAVQTELMDLISCNECCHRNGQGETIEQRSISVQTGTNHLNKRSEDQHSNVDQSSSSRLTKSSVKPAKSSSNRWQQSLKQISPRKEDVDDHTVFPKVTSSVAGDLLVTESADRKNDSLASNISESRFDDNLAKPSQTKVSLKDALEFPSCDRQPSSHPQPSSVSQFNLPFSPQFLGVLNSNNPIPQSIQRDPRLRKKLAIGNNENSEPRLKTMDLSKSDQRKVMTPSRSETIDRVPGSPPVMSLLSSSRSTQKNDSSIMVVIDLADSPCKSHRLPTIPFIGDD